MKSDGKWATCLVTHPNPNTTTPVPTTTTTTTAAAATATVHHTTSSSHDMSESSPIMPPASDLFRSLSGSTTSSKSHHSTHHHSPRKTGGPGYQPSQPAFSAKKVGSVTPVPSPVNVPGFTLGPWSPSVEEAIKLREPIMRQTSLDTLNSSSARSVSPRPAKSSSTSNLDYPLRFRSVSNQEDHLHHTHTNSNSSLTSSNTKNNTTTTTATTTTTTNNNNNNHTLNNTNELGILHTNLSRITLSQSIASLDDNTPTTNSTRPVIGLTSHRICAAKSPLSNSTSMADLSSASSHSALQEHTHNSPPIHHASQAIKKVLLPPLVTNFGAPRLSSSPPSAATDGIPANHEHNSSEKKTHSARLAFHQGPASAAAYVPPIGHSLARTDSFNLEHTKAFLNTRNTAAPGIRASTWLSQKERLVGESTLKSNHHQTPTTGGGGGGTQEWIPTSPQPTSSTPLSALAPHLHQQILINQQLQQLQQLQAQQRLLQQQQVNLLHSAAIGMPTAGGYVYPVLPSCFYTPTRLPGTITNNGIPIYGPSKPIPPLLPSSSSSSSRGMMTTGLRGRSLAEDLEVQELIKRKGYNPNEIKSSMGARFFVIKSYTEGDVCKSIEHEIWASTELGNKRLDRAYGEQEGRPVYLLFSVNASGHFCGMAEMMSGVDYSRTSSVWAEEDKWKGVFKVRWIFVKDVPNGALRHIRLGNTPENKPITSSRDTQEVPYEKGVQVLQIMASYQARTSLLQDYGWYEKGGEEGSDTTRATPPTRS